MSPIRIQIDKSESILAQAVLDVLNRAKDLAIHGTQPDPDASLGADLF